MCGYDCHTHMNDCHTHMNAWHTHMYDWHTQNVCKTHVLWGVHSERACPTCMSVSPSMHSTARRSAPFGGSSPSRPSSTFVQWRLASWQWPVCMSSSASCSRSARRVAASSLGVRSIYARGLMMSQHSRAMQHHAWQINGSTHQVGRLQSYVRTSLWSALMVSLRSPDAWWSLARPCHTARLSGCSTCAAL